MPKVFAVRNNVDGSRYVAFCIVRYGKKYVFIENTTRYVLLEYRAGFRVFRVYTERFRYTSYKLRRNAFESSKIFVNYVNVRSFNIFAPRGRNDETLFGSN